VIEAMVALVGVGSAAAAGVWWPRRDRLMRRQVRATVVASLKSGSVFRGVLFDVDGRTLVLRNAEALTGDGVERGPIPVDGELVVARSDVEFLQRP
jgi:hypothetical protein